MKPYIFAMSLMVAISGSPSSTFGADSCKVSIGQGQFLDIAREQDLASAFRVIALAPSGQAVLKKFMPLYLSGKVTIKDFSIGKLYEAGATGVAGEYQYDSKTLTIPLGVVPVGTLAQIVVHEMVHAVDDFESPGREVDLSPRREAILFGALRNPQLVSSLPLSVEDKKLLEYPEHASELVCRRSEKNFQHEKHAYDVENAFNQEFLKSHACFGEMFASDKVKFKDLPPFSSEDIIKSYSQGVNGEISPLCTNQIRARLDADTAMASKYDAASIPWILDPNSFVKRMDAPAERESDATEFETQLKRVNVLASSLYSGFGSAGGIQPASVLR